MSHTWDKKSYAHFSHPSNFWIRLSNNYKFIITYVLIDCKSFRNIMIPQGAYSNLFVILTFVWLMIEPIGLQFPLQTDTTNRSLFWLPYLYRSSIKNTKLWFPSPYLNNSGKNQVPITVSISLKKTHLSFLLCKFHNVNRWTADTRKLKNERTNFMNEWTEINDEREIQKCK